MATHYQRLLILLQHLGQIGSLTLAVGLLEDAMGVVYKLLTIASALDWSYCWDPYLILWRIAFPRVEAWTILTHY